MRTPCVVVGAGPAGLAMSQALVERGVDHVVLERDEPANTWRTQRWDNFRLNTPDWMNAMLGTMAAGTFCGRDEVVQRLTSLAESLPVRANSPVEWLTTSGSGFVIRTSAEEIHADAIVLAHGLLNVPRHPPSARDVSPRVLQLHASDYRSADELPAGGVLVVGGGQSGCQIAEDLADAGRRVSLATCRVGRYNWAYRGRETFHWLDDLGFWAQRPAELADPSMMRMTQPIVASGGRTLSLPLLAQAGVRLLGRVKGVQGELVTLEGDASMHATVGDEFWARMAGLIDTFIDQGQVEAPPREQDEGAGTVAADATTTLDLADADIGTVIWCTGFSGDLSFTDLPLAGRDGLPRHDGSASFVPGVWLQGFPWLTQRRSGIFYGFPDDAAETAAAVTTHLSSARTAP